MTPLRCAVALCWLVVAGILARNIGDATEGGDAEESEELKLPEEQLDSDLPMSSADVPRGTVELAEQGVDVPGATLEIPRISVETSEASTRVHQSSVGLADLARKPSLDEDPSVENVFSGMDAASSADVPFDVASRGQRNFKVPVKFADEAHDNDTTSFRPSVHLGEIESPRSKPGPFNNLQHVRFENTVDVNDHRVLEQDKAPEYFEQRGNRVKFEDDGYVYQASRIVHYDHAETHSNHGTRPLKHTHSSRSHFEDPSDASKLILEQQRITQNQYMQNLDRVPVQHSAHETGQTIFGKPSRFHDEVAHDQGYAAGLSNPDTSRLPYLIHGYYNNHNSDDKDVGMQETAYDTFHKPDSQVLYLPQQQEPTITQPRKLPYQVYPYPGSLHEFQFYEEPHALAYMPRRRRISPWKKIIQLISAFLPLGLLLAALTPNVVRIDNTTEPNIVLSKWRVNDQAVEHKQARAVDDDPSDVCEDRSICELILAGGKPQSNLLQNILWNLATRTSRDMARRSDLQEVFEAVKSKDCASIDCQR